MLYTAIYRFYLSITDGFTDVFVMLIIVTPGATPPYLRQGILSAHDIYKKFSEFRDGF